MSSFSTERLSVRLTGRVQGVGFRHFTRQAAQRLDVAGWVRNESDGSVRVEAEGPREDLEDLLEAVQAGPRSARVEDASSEWGAASGDFDGFGVRH